MKRPKNDVVEGLKTIAGFIGAGSSADLLGLEEDSLSDEQLIEWMQIQEACDWIKDL